MPVADSYPLCRVEDVRGFLGVSADETLDETRLAKLIAVASAQMTGYCGRSFRQSDVAGELHDGDGTSTLEVSLTPIISVSKLSIDGQAVDIAELAIYPVFVAFRDTGEWNPRLRSYGRVFPAGRQNVSISYRAGYAAVPADVANACVLQVVHLMNTANKQGIVSDTNAVAQATTTYSQVELAPPVRVVCNRYRQPRVAII